METCPRFPHLSRELHRLEDEGLKINEAISQATIQCTCDHVHDCVFNALHGPQNPDSVIQFIQTKVIGGHHILVHSGRIAA